MQEHRPADWWKAGDIWSAGCVFFQMLTRTLLFEAKDKTALLSQIFMVSECKPSQSDFVRFPILNSVEDRLALPLSTKLVSSNIGVEATELLTSMLAFDPVQRITAVDILRHKYFASTSYSTDVHRTCPLANDATDDNIMLFVQESCGGL
jgi:serine/threonine protein kinase